MKYKVFIGIDVSKKTLDVYILSIKKHFTVSNDTEGFAKLLEICFSNVDRKEIFFCFENTGRYSRLLSIFLCENNIPFLLANALDLKKSMGILRGKSDKKDAHTIALYAWKKRDTIQPSVLQSNQAVQLKQLLRLRDKLIKHRTAYKNAICDIEQSFPEGECDFIVQSQKRSIDHFNVEIEIVDNQIELIIQSTPAWNINYNLIQTIKGIGPVVAKHIMVYTENFTLFSDARKFACFAGIAPFEYTSGTSVRGKTRVHFLGNKHLKSLLNTAAMAVIQINGEYKTYYNRRTAEGKNKMSTLNIIRNKLLFRVFAVVKRGTPYVDLSKFAA